MKLSTYLVIITTRYNHYFLSFVVNLEYRDATYYWDAPNLFSNTLDVLLTKIYDDTEDFIGPSMGVELLRDESGVEFTDETASITLGEYCILID